MKTSSLRHSGSWLPVILLLWTFALSRFAPAPWNLISFPALLSAGMVMALGPLPAAMGFQKPTGKKAAWLLPLLISAILACWYRYRLGLAILPAAIQGFVLVSVLIGLTEELIFRGYIQGVLATRFQAAAVYISAFAFALYKALIFAWPGPANQSDPGWLFALTFPAALLLGYSRWKSASVYPAMAAHGLFDLLVYAETAQAPWWVWS